MTAANERFKKAIEPFRLNMDEEAKDILDDLTKKIKITSITPLPKDMLRDNEVIIFDEFKGKNVSVMLVTFVKPEEDFINQQIEECRLQQFY